MLGESCSWFKEKPVTLSGEGATERAAIAIAEQEGSRTDGGGSQVFIKDDHMEKEPTVTFTMLNGHQVSVTGNHGMHVYAALDS